VSSSILLRTIARIILPPAFLYAAYVLFRGHNLPGGGFCAGLLTAAAMILQYVAIERRAVEERSPLRPEALIGLGLALAAATGLAAMALSYPFLTSAFAHVHVPYLGNFESSSALFFDLGVYFVVTGITLTILLVIGD
jgi:multicomponent K+:H+ antiporter subunit A